MILRESSSTAPPVCVLCLWHMQTHRWLHILVHCLCLTSLASIVFRGNDSSWRPLVRRGELQGSSRWPPRPHGEGLLITTCSRYFPYFFDFASDRRQIKTGRRNYTSHGKSDLCVDRCIRGSALHAGSKVRFVFLWKRRTNWYDARSVGSTEF